ncbi:MAG: SPASM domain-containing protein [Phycisphaeraceae bacterium]
MTTLSNSLDRRLAQAVATTGRWKAGGKRRQAMAWLTGSVDFFARGIFWAWRNRKYITPLKMANMAVVNVEFFFKRERLIGRPYSMKIESTNICNTRCQLCPTGLGLRGRRKGRMAYEQYTKLIEQVKRHLFSLDLSMWGDPLVAPDIYKMIGHAHKNGIWTYISSNLHGFKIEHRKQRDGSLEEIDDATKLIQSGLDMLTCSLHGASQETFAIYQPGKDFGNALDKVKHIVATKKRLGSNTPAIQLNFVVTKHNEHEIEPFREMADSLGCKPIFSTASMNIRFLDKDKKLTPLGLADDVLAKKTKDHLDDWLPKNKDYVLSAYDEMRESGTHRSEEYNGKKTYNCSWPWRQSVINWDGSVATCCGSFEEREDIASVIEQSFSKVWNSEKYRMARRSFKKRLDMTQSEDNPCATCPGFML